VSASNIRREVWRGGGDLLGRSVARRERGDFGDVLQRGIGVFFPYKIDMIVCLLFLSGVNSKIK
jgi:hypothetical protein